MNMPDRPTSLSPNLGLTIAVIPAYNEAGNITDIVERTKAYVDEVVVVDDGSIDRTSELAIRAGAKVLRHLINRGQGAAEQTGTDWALNQGAQFVIHIDADGQHDPADISNLLAPLATGDYDISLGSRFLGAAQNIPLARRLILGLGLIFIRAFTGLNLTDSQNGFRAMTRSTAQFIRITHDDMAHASEILDQIAEQKLRYVEVPVTISYSAYSLERGQSNLNSLRIVWRLIIEKFF
jgi:glycosyltransferase involved in cell wall biosynthesis